MQGELNKKEFIVKLSNCFNTSEKFYKEEPDNNWFESIYRQLSFIKDSYFAKENLLKALERREVENQSEVGSSNFNFSYLALREYDGWDEHQGYVNDLLDIQHYIFNNLITDPSYINSESELKQLVATLLFKLEESQADADGKSNGYKDRSAINIIQALRELQNSLQDNRDVKKTRYSEILRKNASAEEYSATLDPSEPKKLRLIHKTLIISNFLDRNV